MSSASFVPSVPSAAAASWNTKASNTHHLAKAHSPPPLLSPTSSTAVVATGVRLDAYHPTLSTGISDVRIQDAILEHPIVRALIVPECDLEARRRCIALISNAIKAANPVLHFLLQYQKKQSESQNSATLENASEPPKDLLTHFKLLTHFLCTVPTSENLVRFWLKHYEHELESQIMVYGEDVLEAFKKDLPACDNTPLDTEASIHEMPLTTLYSKIRKARDILQDLADRVQGAVCIVFWESWDAIYQPLAEIVGDNAMKTAEAGRIFRPSGNAAIYINRRKIEMRNQLHRQQRIRLHEKVKTGDQQKPQDIKVTPSFQQKKSMESVLMTPPEASDSLKDHDEHKVAGSSPMSMRTPTEPNDTHDDDIQALIDLCEKDASNNKNSTEVDDENSEAWPLKLVSAPVSQDQTKPLPLIDSTELDGIMNTEDASEEVTEHQPLASLKRSSLSTSSGHEHSELRKRIRLLEDEEPDVTTSSPKPQTHSPVLNHDDDSLFADFRDTTPDQISGSWPHGKNVLDGRSGIMPVASSIVW